MAFLGIKKKICPSLWNHVYNKSLMKQICPDLKWLVMLKKWCLVYCLLLNRLLCVRPPRLFKGWAFYFTWHHKWPRCLRCIRHLQCICSSKWHRHSKQRRTESIPSVAGGEKLTCPLTKLKDPPLEAFLANWNNFSLDNTIKSDNILFILSMCFLRLLEMTLLKLHPSATISIIITYPHVKFEDSTSKCKWNQQYSHLRFLIWQTEEVDVRKSSIWGVSVGFLFFDQNSHKD